MIKNILLRAFYTLSSTGSLLQKISLSSEISLISIVAQLVDSNFRKIQIYFFFIMSSLLLFNILFLSVGDSFFKFSSFAVAVITLSVISFSNLERLYESKLFLVKFAFFSVFISFFTSLTETFFIDFIDARTNLVFVLERFTFFFDEPSHYGIFLALVLHMCSLKGYGRFFALVLFFGLLMTWSLSGFLLWVLIFLYKNVTNFNKKAFKSFFFFFIFCLFLFVFWVGFVSHLDFWLVHKLESIFLLFSGENKVSSALLRYNSTFMFVNYFYECYLNADFQSFLFGEGFGNLSKWINDFYYYNFGINEIGEVSSFLSAIAIQNGFVGLSIFFVSFYSCFSSSSILKPNFFHFSVLIFFLSLFSGFAYGSLAILYYFILIIIAVDIRKKLS
ncbi:hypothetical protein [Alishewanella sp. SMS8]|uniref:hypothetical protein n=1 Tax=Alishewanella sp. SMS8 TaxID=2994676 RepID=UPI0027425D7A|nr:hypothetical protein [Alishewanella sp. SMS8]MDP5460136.1 hypothetical protein [Alishewanella sp. SMS8]